MIQPDVRQKVQWRKKLLLTITTDFFWKCNSPMHSLESSYKTECLLCAFFFFLWWKKKQTYSQWQWLHHTEDAATIQKVVLDLDVWQGPLSCKNIECSFSAGAAASAEKKWYLGTWESLQYFTHGVAKNFLSPLHRSTSVVDQLSGLLECLTVMKWKKIVICMLVAYIRKEENTW